MTFIGHQSALKLTLEATDSTMERNRGGLCASLRDGHEADIDALEHAGGERRNFLPS